jgi:hypothetical protein
MYNMRITRDGARNIALIAKVASVAFYAFTYNITFRGLNLQGIDSAYVKYLAELGKSYVKKAQYEVRQAIFEQNMALISENNA